MSRRNKRLLVASLALGLGLAGPAAAGANDAARFEIFGDDGVKRVLADDLPAITGDIEGGLGGLLGGTGLLGGVLGGTGQLLDGLVGSLGVVLDPQLSIQPVPPLGGPTLENPKVGGGLLDSLFGIGSLTESLAGRI